MTDWSIHKEALKRFSKILLKVAVIMAGIFVIGFLCEMAFGSIGVLIAAAIIIILGFGCLGYKDILSNVKRERGY